MLSGFKKFILRGNVVDLAVGVVIGSAFTAIVSSFVKDLLTPLLSLIGGQPNYSSQYWTVGQSRFMYGDFLDNLISFLIISLVIYFLVILPINKLHAIFERRPTSPTSKKCPFCLSEIAKDAKKCAFCTSNLK